MVTCGLILAFACGAENLLLNPSFETLYGDLPGHWHVFLAPESGATGGPDGTVAFDGDYSVNIRNPRTLANDPCNNWSQNITLDLSGATLHVQGHIKVEEASQAVVWLQCWGKDPWGTVHVATTSNSAPVSGTLDWTPVEMRVEVPDGTDFVTLRCVLKGRGAAWFDDFSITKTDDHDESKAKPAAKAAAESETETQTDEGGESVPEAESTDAPAVPEASPSAPDKEPPEAEPAPAAEPEAPEDSAVVGESAPEAESTDASAVPEASPSAPDEKPPEAEPAPPAEAEAPEDSAVVGEDALEAAAWMSDVIRSLSETNEALTDQVGRLEQEIGGLRRELEALQAASEQLERPGPAAPPGASSGLPYPVVEPRRRAPPLVPHGYNLEEMR